MFLPYIQDLTKFLINLNCLKKQYKSRKTNEFQISKINLFVLVTINAKVLKAKKHSQHLKCGDLLNKLSSYTATVS